MTTYAGHNLLYAGEDFTKIIPTRMPKSHEPTRTVSLEEAIEIAKEFYWQRTIPNNTPAYKALQYRRRKGEA